jgi:hypothetical protein
MTLRSWLGSGNAGEFTPGVFVIRHPLGKTVRLGYHGVAGPAAS